MAYTELQLTDILLIVVIILLVINMIILLVRTGRRAKEGMLYEQGRMLDEIEDDIISKAAMNISDIRFDINTRLEHDNEENRRNRTEVSDMISRNQDKLERSLREAVSQMQVSNERRLDNIRTEITRKLDTSLNERLDSSFRTVGDQLRQLYVSLGELNRLENGVESLNRTLSNVKTRGIFGELQLENILSEILPGTLYDRNVVTKKSGGANRDAVEFAVRIPDKETTGKFMYLPIDSKFPMTYYERIVEASESGASDELKRAVKELEQRVKADARDIQDKYLDPPDTTDFGIMFLPTESLYAEVLRISGLVELCQKHYHVVITGPSTLAALLNSLNVGFRYMAINRNSQKILKLLSAIKTQYATLNKLIDQAGNRIDMARKATDELHRRADIINNRLSGVEELDPLEANALLGLRQESDGGQDYAGVMDTEDFLNDGIQQE